MVHICYRLDVQIVQSLYKKFDVSILILLFLIPASNSLSTIVTVKNGRYVFKIVPLFNTTGTYKFIFLRLETAVN